MAGQTPIEFFKKLEVEFELDPQVTARLTSPDGLAAKTLDDLLYACSGDGFEKLAKAAKPTNAFLAASRSAGCDRPGAR